VDYIRFNAGDATLVLACNLGDPLRIVHWGHRLDNDTAPEDVVTVTRRFGGPGHADINLPASLALEPGLGLLGPNGFAAHREGRDWGSRFVVCDVVATATRAQIACRDARTKLTLAYDIALDAGTAVLSIATTLVNNGDAVLDLVEMATACLPVPSHMDEIIGFSGRWSGEFRRERVARFSGGYIRENRRGRTSHDSFPAVILCTAATNETQGEAFGFHLAWSGNHRIRVDSVVDGQVFASLGALLFPGEIRLAPGARYQSPQIIAAYSAHGFSALSQCFHRHVRDRLLRPSTRAKPRPVHYNTWEAVYFDHDVEKLKGIADRAAAIGVERFVLDDGWFGSRRNDLAGLGDWTVSTDVYPDGLKPLIDHVIGLGMEMGIWFEPEMVNPDSALFRAHPDWVLQIGDVEQVPYRCQYVLDISRAEVSDYLFACIDALLSTHAISYIKWDMNRDLNHPGDIYGHARAFAQVEALYALIDRVRGAHPEVEIESCASGGARPDMGILAHTDRIWTSDTNDALDRQSIQRGASFFLPLNVLGAHVGPGQCHQTGRKLSMAMRAGTALMGHMGLELNLLEEPADDLVTLKTAVALHKTHRDLLHSGDFVRIDTASYLNVVGVIATDRRDAIFSVAVLTGCPTALPDRIRFSGLSADARYRVRLIWPIAWRPKQAVSAIGFPDYGGEGVFVSGSVLMSVGLQMPAIDPETVLLFHLTT
jgi:alpha-galactosidase